MNRLWLAVAFSLGVASCAEETTRVPDESTQKTDDEQKLGHLSLSLTGTDSRGRQYRLRNAEFYVYGGYYYPYSDYPYDDYPYPTKPGYYPYPGSDGGAGFSTLVSTETDPDAASINLTLVPGQYYVQLQGEWYVERLTENGAERVERVVLLTDPYQYTYIYNGGYSYLPFRFGVDGELIDFRHGELAIAAEFELPEDSQYPSYDAGYPLPPIRRDAGVRPTPGYDAGVAEEPPYDDDDVVVIVD